MADVHAALGGAGLGNVHVREYVRHWAGLTGAARIEVISASDDARLIGEALAEGEILPAGEGRYYSRSYVKDTARSEERTVVATSNPADKGVYNNWRPASEMRRLLAERMRGASVGKTMYVVPYLMAPAGSPLERYAAGVQLTDCRTVALHMIRMARLGVRGVPRRAVHAHRHYRQADRPALPHLRRLPERFGQDQPCDDARARRARRPVPRRLLRRRHRVAACRPR